MASSHDGLRDLVAVRAPRVFASMAWEGNRGMPKAEEPPAPTVPEPPAQLVNEPEQAGAPTAPPPPQGGGGQ